MSCTIANEAYPEAEFKLCLGMLPDGHMRGEFKGRRWGVTVRRSPDDRRLWLYGEELGGKDIVSFNLFVGSGDRRLLKPCEMSSTKVIDFVLGFQPDRSAASPGRDDPG